MLRSSKTYFKFCFSLDYDIFMEHYKCYFIYLSHKKAFPDGSTAHRFTISSGILLAWIVSRSRIWQPLYEKLSLLNGRPVVLNSNINFPVQLL